MYEAFFGFQKRPFAATPDLDCFFATAEAQKAFTDLRRCVTDARGIGVLTAAGGLGKTLLCRRLLQDLRGEHSGVFISHGHFSSTRAFLQTLLYEFGFRHSGLEEHEFRLEIVAGWKADRRAGHWPVILLDEAHLLSTAILEEVRALANVSEGGEPLAGFVLAGQPELEERLVLPELQALNARIGCQSLLEPLSRQASRDYIDFRLAWTGAELVRTFTAEALDLIVQASNGLPRSLNHLCDHALLLAYVAETRPVTCKLVEDALADLRQLPLHWNAPLQWDELSDPDAGSSSSESPLVEAQFDDLAPATNLPRVSAGPTVALEIGSDGAVFSGIGWVEASPPQMPASAAATLIESDAAQRFPLGHVATEAEWIPGTIMENALHSQSPLNASRPTDRLQPAASECPTLSFEAARDGFEEEAVFDRYALLDAGRDVPPSGDARWASAPSPKLEHAVADEEHAGLQLYSDATQLPRPDQIIDEILPMLQQAMGDDEATAEIRIDRGVSYSIERFSPVTDPIDSCSITAGSPAPEVVSEPWVVSEYGPIDQGIEHLVGSSVLHVVEAVEHAMAERLRATELSPGALDTRPAPAFSPDRSAASPYDTIEPEGEELAVASEARASVPADTAPRDFEIRRPNYRRVFSALRRKLGKESRDEGRGARGE